MCLRHLTHGSVPVAMLVTAGGATAAPLTDPVWRIVALASWLVSPVSDCAGRGKARHTDSESHELIDAMRYCIPYCV